MLLELSPDPFVLGHVPPECSIPPAGVAFFSRTNGEYSLLCEETQAPPSLFDPSPSWRMFRVAGKLDLSLIGILQKLALCLKNAGVPLLCQSTYDTDYLFVPGLRLQDAINAFRAGGHAVRRVCHIRRLSPDEYENALLLVNHVHSIFEMPAISPLGVKNMHAYASAENFRTRPDHILYGAFSDGRLCGVLGTEHATHIGLLFVDTPCQYQGVARQLIDFIAQGQPYLDLNAAPYAYGFYRKLGFVPKGEESHRGGMITTPMERRINPE